VHAPDAGPGCHHKDRLGKAGFEESLINLLGKSQIEIKFVGSARAFSTGRFRGVADVENNAKIRMGAARHV
jgi:hypothetical protein